MIEALKAILLGIIEGITEWLPISSTGHLIIAEKLLHFSNGDEAFKEMFEVVIQLGAVLAVVVLYFKKLWPFCKDKSQKYIKKDTFSLWGKVLVGVLPAGVIGLLFDDKINSYFYNESVNAYVIAATLIFYGILFIVIEKVNKNRVPKIETIDNLSIKTAVFIGMFQVLSMIPGTSRSGITILGAILLGVSRTLAAEYSFFMALPVMFGASLLKIVKYISEITSKEDFVLSDYITQWSVLAVGMITAFVVSVLAIKFFIDYIKKKDFSVFGYYRIALGIAVIVFFTFIF